MELFGVGIGEAGLVLLITLLVVGPERFPQIAREGGKYYRMARRFTAEVTGDLSMALKELENEVNEQTGDLKTVREIGNEVRTGVQESTTDIDSIGRGAATAASAATPEGRRESEAAQPLGAPPMTVPAGGDPFARVTAVYSDYHAPSTPAAEAASEANGDELSRQATEAFDEFRKPAPAVPYSPQQIVGVNPFASADPVMATPASIPAPAPDEIEAPSVEGEEPAAALPSDPGVSTGPSSTSKPALGA